jgi:hypothetical protein
MDGAESVLVGHIAPTAADCPGAETDSRDIPAGSAKWSILHGYSPLIWLLAHNWPAALDEPEPLAALILPLIWVDYLRVFENLIDLLGCQFSSIYKNNIINIDPKIGLCYNALALINPYG